MTLNALAVFYAHNLADDGIKVNALAPGPRRRGAQVDTEGQARHGGHRR